MALYISHGSLEDVEDPDKFDRLRRTKTPELWTVNSHVEFGDRVVIYIGQPISALVAVARVVGTKLVDGKRHGWPGYEMTDVQIEHVIKPRISFRDLQKNFPKWGWPRMPLEQAAVPPEIVDPLFKLIGANRELTRDEHDSEIEQRAQVSSAGFGDAEKNRKVERAAVNFAKCWLAKEGWKIKRDCQLDRCGYDLLVTRGNKMHQVEVKGVSGPIPGFVLTPGELKFARKNESFRLIIVTNALDRKLRDLAIFTPKEMLARFNLEPVSFLGRLKNANGLVQPIPKPSSKTL